MAGLFDRGRERAKLIVDKVAKAARPKESDQPVTIDSKPKVTTGQLSTTSKKPYAFTAFKRALDDTDTLLLKLNSMPKDSDVSKRDQGPVSTSTGAGKPNQVDSSSKQGPLTEGMRAWDLPLSSFQQTSMPRASSLDSSAVQMVSQPTTAETSDTSVRSDSPGQFTTTAAAADAVPAATPTGPDVLVTADDPAVPEPTCSAAATQAVSTGLGYAAEAPAAPAAVDQLPAHGLTDDAAAAAAGVEPNQATTTPAVLVGSREPVFVEPVAAATAVPWPSPATLSAVPSRVGSSEVDAFLEVQPQTFIASNTACAATSDLAAPAAGGTLSSTAAQPAVAKAASGVSRPGVADAANLIAPGLVAKRRAAALAAVESKGGPSPELQASPVIETEGKADTKTKSHVTLSMW